MLEEAMTVLCCTNVRCVDSEIITECFQQLHNVNGNKKEKYNLHPLSN